MRRIIVIVSIAITLIVSGVLLNRQSSAVVNRSLTEDELREQYSSMPLVFQLNKGQVDERVRFLVRGGGQNIFFTPTEVAYTFLESERENDADAKPRALAVKQFFAKANEQVVIEGQDQLSGKVNYLIGNDPKKWQTEVPTYASIVYSQLYPGIDLRYSGEDGSLKYEFTVAGGVSPNVIAMTLEGIDSLSVSPMGDLVLKTALGNVGLQKPVAYQVRGEERVPVEVSYAIVNDTTYGFTIGAYDATLPLIIDPRVLYGTYLGGSLEEEARAITIDSSGNAYVTGWTLSTNFPGVTGFFDSSHNTGRDVFVTKFNSTASTRTYSTYLGGSGTDEGLAIALDSSNQAVIAGQSTSAGYPVTVGVVQSGLAASTDAVVTKLNVNGTGLIFSTYYGGQFVERAHGLAIDAADNIYFVGQTNTGESALPPFPLASAFDGTLGGADDAFIVKLNSTASTITFASYLGGSASEQAFGVAVTPLTQRIAITGQTTSADFPLDGEYQSASGGGTDAFVTLVNDDGSGLWYSTYLGGSGTDIARGIAVQETSSLPDPIVYMYVVGSTTSSNFPTRLAVDTTLGGTQDAFISKFESVNPGDPSLLGSTYTGGTGNDTFHAVYFESTDELVYATGESSSTNFPLAGAYATTLSGTSDIVVSKYGSTLSPLAFSTYHRVTTSSGIDIGYGIAADSSENVYVAGRTTSTGSGMSTSGVSQVSFGGGTADAYVFKASTTNEAPQIPVRDMPDIAGKVVSTTPTFSARYQDLDSFDFGTVNVRVSTGSTTDCTNNIGVVATGTSAATTSTNVIVTVTVSPALTDGQTYSWCAQNNDGVLTSAWTAMSTFTVEVAGSDVLFASYLGGTTTEDPADVFADASGNMIIVGQTSGGGYPTTGGVIGPTAMTPTDGFITQFSSTGSLIMSTFIGGNNDDELWAGAVDSSGNIYSTGLTYSSDFPTLNGFDTTVDTSNGDAFVLKVNSGATAVLYGTIVGGTTDFDFGTSLALTGTTVAITGEAYSTDLPVSSGAYQSSNGGDSDSYLAIVDTSLTGAASKVYLSYIGGTGYDGGYGIGFDSGGLFYITTSAASSNFPVTAGSYDTTYNGGRDAILTVIDPNGAGLADLIYSTRLGTNAGNNTDPYNLYVESPTRVHIAGSTEGTGFPATTNAYDTSFNGGIDDAFYAVMNPAGAGAADLLYATFVGSSLQDNFIDIAFIHATRVVLSGRAVSSDFPVSSPTFDSVHSGSSDAVLVVMNPAGTGASDLIYSTFVGTPHSEGGGYIGLDSTSDLFWASATQGIGFQTTTGAYDSTQANTNERDIIFMKWDFSQFVPAAGPNAPVIISPPNASTVFSLTPELYALYDHDGLTPGTITIRVSSTSTADCINNLNIVDADTSATTSTATEAAGIVTATLTNGSSYYWCAQADDGVDQSAFEAMGQFTVNTALPNGAVVATLFGGSSGEEYGAGIDVDASGNIYVLGYTENTDFPTTAGAYDPTYNTGNNNCTVTKINPQGTALIYSTVVGVAGASVQCGDSLLRVDSTGAAYAAGQTDSASFPVTGGAYDTSHNGGSDIVAFKLNPAGSALVYSTYIGGSGGDRGHYADLDSSNNFYVAGHTSSADYPVTGGVYDGSHNGSGDIVVTKLNSSGTALVFSTFVGGSGEDAITGIDLTATNEIVIGVRTASTDFPVLGSALSATYGGGVEDGLVFKLNSTATALIFSGYIGTTAQERVWGVRTDASENIYILVAANSTGLTTTSGVVQPTYAGGEDLYIMKINGTGTSVSFSTYLGGTGDDGAYRMDLDASGNPVFSAWTCSSDFPLTADALDTDSDAANCDLYITKLNTTGTSVLYSSYYGTDNNFEGTYGLQVRNGLVYMTGQTYSSDFPTTSGAYDSILGGTVDMFVLAYKFPVAAGGGGGGTSIQRIQQLQSLITPMPGMVQVIGPHILRFHWTYDGSSHLGFRLRDEENAIAAETNDSSATAIEETGLPHNTAINGRTIVAYNASGESAPSAPYPEAITHMIPVTPELVTRQGNRIEVQVDQTVNNLSVAQSGLQFQLIPVEAASAAQVSDSPWLQESTYMFEGTDPTVSYLLRSRGRNQLGVETDWSSTISIPAQEFVLGEPELMVSLSLTPSDGQNIANALHPSTIFHGEMSVQNNGSAEAENVLLTLPLPEFITYVPGTLSVGGIRQSDAPDIDAGQIGNRAISAIWPQVEPGFGQTVRFQLGFDTAKLLEAFGAPSRQLESEVVRAAANPMIVLQAQASHSASDDPVYSEPQTVQADVSAFEQAASPEPAPDETVETPVAPTPEQVEIIETILQQEFPSPNQPAPTQPIPTGDTSSSSQDGSFSVETTDGSQTLRLQGTATTNDDQIEFVGTTSQPFTVVTLIFNDSVTAIAVSDANGIWRTFVSAAELGIDAGSSQQVRVEAIAAKGDLRSERVQIADVLVSRGVAGDVVAEFETRVSQQGLIRAAQETVEQTIETIRENEPEIRTALAVSAPIVVASSMPLWGYLPYAPTLIYHLLTYLIGLLGRKNKRGAARFYGVAYDSISKKPLALAIIRIYKTEAVLENAASVGAAAATNKKLVTTIVTDKAGRYEALLEAGTYTLEVSKPQYLFPSQIVTARADGDFAHVYDQNSGIKVEGDQLTIPDVPLDPINARRQWQLASGGKKIWLAIQRVGDYLAVPVLLIGAILSILVVVATPHRWINWAIAILYVGLLAMQLKLRGRTEKSWGVVYDISTNAVLPLTTIQLIEPASSKVVTSRLSDYQGRFAFLPEPGNYVIKANKQGYQQVAEVVEAPQTDRQPLHGEISIENPDQRITGDVAMRPL